MKSYFDSKIQYFIVCAEAKSFSHAARQLSVSQSTLSLAIAKLETELRTKLFHRSRTGTVLTKQGQIALKVFRDHDLKILKELNKRSSSHLALKIGSTSSLASRHVLKSLELLKSNLPPVQLFLNRSLPLYEAVISGRLDFAFVTWTNRPENLTAHLLKSDPNSIFGLKSKFPNLEFEKNKDALKSYPWIRMPKPQYNFTDVFDENAAGVAVENVYDLKKFILSGTGIGEAPENIFTKDEIKLLIKLRFKSIHPQVNIYAISRKDLDPQIKSLLSQITEPILRSS